MKLRECWLLIWKNELESVLKIHIGLLVLMFFYSTNVILISRNIMLWHSIIPTGTNNISTQCWWLCVVVLLSHLVYKIKYFSTEPNLSALDPNWTKEVTFKVTIIGIFNITFQYILPRWLLLFSKFKTHFSKQHERV